MAGLLSNKSAPMALKDTCSEKGRGVFAAAPISKGAYITEYKGDVYPRAELSARCRDYARNEEGSYVLEVQLPDGQGWACIDATRRYNTWGR